MQNEFVPPPASCPMYARLILTAGSRAGLAANIYEGVYLVGREKPCQIRPKSRSVSRKHCALFLEQGSLRVLDLGSTSGTHVNGERIAARTRVVLRDGDQLRCGKITFNVVLDENRKALDKSSGLDEATTKDEEKGDDEQTMISGGALQEADIADLLLDLDEVDRVDRISTLRKQNADAERREAEQAAQVVVGVDDVTFDTDPQFADARVDESPNQPSPVIGNESANQRYKKLDPKTKKTISARMRRKENGGLDPQRLAIVLGGLMLFLLFCWIIWNNYDMFFGEPMVPKDID